MDSYPFAASTMEPNIKRFKVEVSHFFMFFQTSHSEHVELVMVCNANEFMVEWFITFSSHKTCQWLFKIHWKLKRELTSCAGLVSFPATLSSVSGGLWAGGGNEGCVSPGGGTEISQSASCCSLRQLFLGRWAVNDEIWVNGRHT